MTATTTRTPSPTRAERERDALLRRYDIELTDDNRAVLDAYRSRTHRARWWGVVGALVVGALGLSGYVGDDALTIARLLTGYLVGSAVAELLSPQRRAAGAVHTASLTTRGPSLLLPLWARVLPWALLVPCLAAPLLVLGDHPTGTTRVQDETGFSVGSSQWVSTSVLVGIAVLAAAGLVVWRLVLRRLARRRLPVDRPGAARLDLVTRALSARAASGTAAALGLSLLAGLAQLLVEPLGSTTCTAVTQCSYVYPWHAQDSLLRVLGLLGLVAALAVFAFSRRARVDASALDQVATSPR